MHWIANILVGIGAAVASLFGSAQHLAGTTVTTILGSDTLSNSRTTINDNFTALLNGKQEISDLVSTTTWARLSNGVVTVANGGTASTSLSSNQVLLGNGTSGFKTVGGWGSSGMSLVSNGAGLAPTWQSISFDTTASYNLTGSYLGIQNFNASSTVANPIKLNTVSYNTPSSQGAASTTLWNDGSGNLTWTPVSYLLGYSNYTGTQLGASSAATTTLYTVSLPANTIGSAGVIHVRLYARLNHTASQNIFFEGDYGSGTTNLNFINSPSGGENITLDFIISGGGTTNSQKTYMQVQGFESAFSNTFSRMIVDNVTNSNTTDSTAAQTLTLSIRFSSADGNNWLQVYSAEVYRQR